MSGETEAMPAGTVVCSCPLESCKWTFTQAPPDPFAPISVPPAATLDESIGAAAFAITRDWLAVAEQAIGAHLATHTTLEWATEIARLRQVAAGTVMVSRADLALIHDYARQFDVDTDPAMIRVAEILRSSERQPGSSPTGAPGGYGP